jgi:hypothetical protein
MHGFPMNAWLIKFVLSVIGAIGGQPLIGIVTALLSEGITVV